MYADPTHHERVRNILRVYRVATPEERAEGACWYAQAHLACDLLGQRHGRSTQTCAGIVAALSPQMPWEWNLRAADQLCAAWASGGELPRVTAYPANVRKAERIYHGEAPDRVLGGNKVRSFYALMAGAYADPFSGVVCVDGHAINIAEYRLFGTGAGAKHPRSYSAYVDYARAYTVAAHKRGLPAHAMQATTWLAWRRIQKED